MGRVSLPSPGGARLAHHAWLTLCSLNRIGSRGSLVKIAEQYFFFVRPMLTLRQRIDPDGHEIWGQCSQSRESPRRGACPSNMGFEGHATGSVGGGQHQAGRASLRCGRTYPRLTQPATSLLASGASPVPECKKAPGLGAQGFDQRTRPHLGRRSLAVRRTAIQRVTRQHVRRHPCKITVHPLASGAVVVNPR